MTRAVLGGVAGICVVVTGCGLAAGLYRRRYLRGSRDEVRAVLVAGILVACCLGIICVSFGGRRQVLPDSALTMSFALAAMLGGRYVAFAARLRSRPAAPTAERIIVFGAGDAGTQFISRLAARAVAAGTVAAAGRGSPRRPGAPRRSLPRRSPCCWSAPGRRLPCRSGPECSWRASSGYLLRLLPDPGISQPAAGVRVPCTCQTARPA